MYKLLLSLIPAALVGCGSPPLVSSDPTGPKEVRIQFMGAKDWEATAVVVEDGSKRLVTKPQYDTAEFILGRLSIGSTFTMRTGEGRYLFFKRPDSVRIIMGQDTTIRYWPEAGEAVHVVR